MQIRDPVFDMNLDREEAVAVVDSPGSVELETMVRSEWRRRMDGETYRRPHSRSLIRSLIYTRSHCRRLDPGADPN